MCDCEEDEDSGSGVPNGVGVLTVSYPPPVSECVCVGGCVRVGGWEGGREGPG